MDADRKSLQTCRNRYGDRFVVSLDTVKVLQADATERWKSLSCTSDYLRNAPWRCETYGDYRSMRLVDAANSSWEVVIPLEIDVDRARRLVSRAFSLLTPPGEVASCGQGSADDSAKTHAWLLATLRAGGPFELELDPVGFTLSQYPLNVEFGLSPDDTPGLRCWSETDVVVTS